jgi:hypothetical protein
MHSYTEKMYMDTCTSTNTKADIQKGMDIHIHMGLQSKDTNP